MTWWLMAALAAPMWFLWTVAHEAAHAMVVIVHGHKIKKFIPWPHKSERTGKWMFAEVVTDGFWNDRVSIAPYMQDILMFTSAVITACLVQNEYVVSTMMVAAAAGLTNTLVGAQARYRRVNEKADLSKVSWKYSIPFYYTLIAMCGTYTGALVWLTTK